MAFWMTVGIIAWLFRNFDPHFLVLCRFSFQANSYLTGNDVWNIIVASFESKFQRNFLRWLCVAIQSLVCSLLGSSVVDTILVSWQPIATHVLNVFTVKTWSFASILWCVARVGTQSYVCLHMIVFLIDMWSNYSILSSFCATRHRIGSYHGSTLFAIVHMI